MSKSLHVLYKRKSNKSLSNSVYGMKVSTYIKGLNLPIAIFLQRVSTWLSRVNSLESHIFGKELQYFLVIFLFGIEPKSQSRRQLVLRYSHINLLEDLSVCGYNSSSPQSCRRGQPLTTSVLNE
jgi:hypothetical protein